jgi:hypothetical protein
MTAVKSGQAMHSSVSSLDAFTPTYYLHVLSSSHHIFATSLDLIAVTVLGTSKVVPLLNQWVPKVECKVPYDVEKTNVD